MPEKRFIDIKELAEYLSLSVSTLYDWVNQRKIPYVKISNLVRFDLRKIEDWLKEREVEPFKWN